MVAVNSTMLPLGTPAPDFQLVDAVSGQSVSLADVAANKVGTLVMFICRHCPYVKHLEHELARIGQDYGEKIGLVGISSNPQSNYPDDAPALLKEQAERCGFNFPYLYDGDDQSVALAYTAACTPDFFLFDADQRLYYRGQLDDSRPRNETSPPVTGRDLRAALDALLAGEPSPENQVPSMGCNIKWLEHNVPDYFNH